MPLPFSVDYTSYPAYEGDYSRDETEKTKICLHHTAGRSVDGAVTTLRAKDYIMVHFLISEDGMIYQFMPIKNGWAYHMGIKELAKGSVDKHTIGIEINNVGPLMLRDNGRLCFWPNQFNAQYCTIKDTNLYYETDEWRGYTYFATYRSVQYDAVAKLTAYLCKLLEIPPKIFSVNNNFDVYGVKDFTGIFTHNNVRTDKTDLSPAWNWSFYSTKLGAAYDYYDEHFGELNNPLKMSN